MEYNSLNSFELEAKIKCLKKEDIDNMTNEEAKEILYQIAICNNKTGEEKMVEEVGCLFNTIKGLLKKKK